MLTIGSWILVASDFSSSILDYFHIVNVYYYLYHSIYLIHKLRGSLPTVLCVDTCFIGLYL